MLHRHKGRHLCAANSRHPVLFTLQVAPSEHPSVCQIRDLLQVTLWGSMRSCKRVLCQEQFLAEMRTLHWPKPVVLLHAGLLCANLHYQWCVQRLLMTAGSNVRIGPRMGDMQAGAEGCYL